MERLDADNRYRKLSRFSSGFARYIIALNYDEEAMSENRSAAGFPTTQWSRVLRAGDARDREGRDALEQLCRDYWYPLYAFARRRGLDREEAGDLVQGFLADLIERGDLTKADPSRGRFRSFLRTACSHFLSHAREHDRALKRGGGRAPVSIDLRDAEGRYLNEPAHDLTAERLFRAALGDGPARTRLGSPGIGGSQRVANRLYSFACDPCSRETNLSNPTKKSASHCK